MIEIILFAFLYNAIFQNLSIFYETKIAQNFTSAIHLVICLVLNLIFYMTNNLWIYHLASIMTIGHYLFDIFYLLFFKQMSLMTAALIYHHVATMIYVQYNPYLYLGHIVLIFPTVNYLMFPNPKFS